MSHYNTVPLSRSWFSLNLPEEMKLSLGCMVLCHAHRQAIFDDLQVKRDFVTH